MHDTLRYLQQDPVHRKFHHSRLTFSIWYAFTENFVLPLSHDEVVHGKGALIGRMPGDEWQQFANLRLLFGYMWTHPGKKLLFMGGEFGQRREWQHEEALEWHVLKYPLHAGVQRWVGDLNRLYRDTPPLYEQDFTEAGFTWIDCDDADVSVIAFLRRSTTGALALVVCNFTPVPRPAYCIGVPLAGLWRERLNSDAAEYGGSGVGNLGSLHTQPQDSHGHAQSLRVHLPPLALVILTPG
jgi:1,4-alpha-glucan branching enzyme